MNWLARPGEHATFHIACIAGIATGAAMIATSSDMGAVAPLIIAGGFYLIFFALLAEILLGARWLISVLAMKFVVTASNEQSVQTRAPSPSLPQSLLRRPRLQAPGQ